MHQMRRPPPGGLRFSALRFTVQTAWLRDAEGRIRDLVLQDSEIISYT
jgi:hypothetical protein